MAELWREVGLMGETIRALGQEVLRQKIAIINGFKQNRREIRQFRELLDSDWRSIRRSWRAAEGTEMRKRKV